MNILYKSNLTQVMGSTTGGDEVGQARGRMGSRGGRPAQTYGRLALKCGGSWGNFAGTLSRVRGGVCRLTQVGCMGIPDRLTTWWPPDRPLGLLGTHFG
jgi:hypothetical protein